MSKVLFVFLQNESYRVTLFIHVYKHLLERIQIMYIFHINKQKVEVFLNQRGARVYLDLKMILWQFEEEKYRRLNLGKQ